jgi:hypothetical protein
MHVLAQRFPLGVKGVRLEYLKGIKLEIFACHCLPLLAIVITKSIASIISKYFKPDPKACNRLCGEITLNVC